VIKGMHEQQEDSPMRLAWDHEIAVVEGMTTNTSGIVSFHSPDFIPRVHRVGRLEEKSPKESITFH